MLRLGSKQLALPVLQGGMGVGVSLGGLAGAVAVCGGMGCISTAQTGFREPDFLQHTAEANLRALKKEIAKAKACAKGAGLVAINAMVATRQYADAVRAAVEAGVDAVICGAGLPLDLPGLVLPETLIAPVVSSARAAQVICKTWLRRFARLPDFIVLEGSEAGGHLGFEETELQEGRCASLDELLPPLLKALAPFEEKAGRSIPVFVAGGIDGGTGLSHYRKLGAAGVQIATPFIATHECDASPAYKEALLHAKAEDVRIMHSPVGMPGRALNTPLIQRLASGLRQPPVHCTGCIHGCVPTQTPFCITEALIAAVRGDLEHGLFFCGAHVERLTQLTSVQELMDKIAQDWRNSQ